jgi:uncharacterized protein YgiB involved in biofilm formation
MKNRTTTFSAALLVGVAAFCLAGCDDDKPKENAVKVYSNVDECKADHSVDECTKAFEGAQHEHEVSAPHIPTREECIAKYGVDACVPHHDSSGDWFGPAMTGFMIGHMLGSSPAYQPVYVYGGHAYSGGAALGTYRRGGFVTVAPSSSWTKNYNTTIIQQSSKGGSYAIAPSSRGGFGGSASAIGKSTPSIGKASSSVPSSIAAPSMSSARGGFGGAAAGASAGG